MPATMRTMNRPSANPSPPRRDARSRDATPSRRRGGSWLGLAAVALFVPLRAALARASSGQPIEFAPGLDGGTITLSIVGEPRTILVGYFDRDYGRSALYARKHVVIDASTFDGEVLELVPNLVSLTGAGVKVASPRGFVTNPREASKQQLRPGGSQSGQKTRRFPRS